MKSVVFSFKRGGLHKRNFRVTPADVRCYIKRNAVLILFVTSFLCGIVFGSFYAKSSDNQLLDSLDFLFTTNLDARLAQNAVNTFCACFASDFVFLAAVFLLGITPWGIPILPFVSLFKGFGTGITATYLIVSYSLKGAGFYLLVILPGTFLFCLALVGLSVFSFDISKRMFIGTIGHSDTVLLKSALIDFCFRSITALIMTFFSSLLDTVLWCLFSGMFNF